MTDSSSTVLHIISIIFLIYGVVISVGYALISIFSILEIKDYKRKNNYEDENALLQAEDLPSVSILAPAYNEGLNIVENVRSLVTINYPSVEIIIINDGSSDHTLDFLITEYELEKVNTMYYDAIKTKKIRGIYKSRNKAYKHLTVIDKVNGGKSDALNAGINVCTHKLICCIDVDCILEDNAMIKLVKPFLNNQRKVIASGGVIRVANSCVIEDGKIVEVKLPEKFIARVQILEYFRAFLMGRMAWSKVDGLLIISGAFGMFDKEVVIDCGGYNTKTVGEDMELLVRMRRLMLERKTKYSVGFIPDPLCWTEVPQDWKVLRRQRNRWARGTAETLWIHRKMLLNPKYKVLGLLSIPYWFLFEWLAPIIEFLGLLLFVFLWVYYDINWMYFLTFFAVVYSFAILFSVMSLFFEEYSFQQYKKPKAIVRLLLTAFLEPILFHPVVTWSAILGNLDLLRGKKNWGEMTRSGFTNSVKKKKEKRMEYRSS
ncbi:glycosyltransferase [Zhouia sp. PK063]|uniref:glycosyltransferase n=1 Tax=Zhouia sp. PK063 TaxID=3373602 RepID=UPI0037B7C23E